MKSRIIGGLTAIALAGSVLIGRAPRTARRARSTTASIGTPAFREHKRTFGLVYTLPKEVNDLLEHHDRRTAA